MRKDVGREPLAFRLRRGGPFFRWGWQLGDEAGGQAGEDRAGWSALSRGEVRERGRCAMERFGDVGRERGVEVVVDEVASQRRREVVGDAFEGRVDRGGDLGVTVPGGVSEQPCSVWAGGGVVEHGVCCGGRARPRVASHGGPLSCVEAIQNAFDFRLDGEQEQR